MNAFESRGRGYVIVGLDRDAQPTRPLTMAADEAQRRGAELAVVTILRPNLDPELSIHELRQEEHRTETAALQNLHRVTASLRSSHPQVRVTTYCLGEGEVGPNREPLLWAQLLVIGTQDRYDRQASSTPAHLLTAPPGNPRTGPRARPIHPDRVRHPGPDRNPGIRDPPGGRTGTRTPPPSHRRNPARHRRPNQRTIRPGPRIGEPGRPGRRPMPGSGRPPQSDRNPSRIDHRTHPGRYTR